MYAPSFAWSVIFSDVGNANYKYKESIGKSNLRAYFCCKAVVNPVGNVNAESQNTYGWPFNPQFIKKFTLSFKSLIQNANGLILKYQNSQYSGTLFSFNLFIIYYNYGDITTNPFIAFINSFNDIFTRFKSSLYLYNYWIKTTFNGLSSFLCLNRIY